MLYSSLHKFQIKEFLIYGKNKYKNRFIPAFGTIATGIRKNEPILSFHTLERDLKLANELKIEEVIIYRLGGLNREYIKIINKLLQSNQSY